MPPSLRHQQLRAVYFRQGTVHALYLPSASLSPPIRFSISSSATPSPPSKVTTSLCDSPFSTHTRPHAPLASLPLFCAAMRKACAGRTSCCSRPCMSTAALERADKCDWNFCPRLVASPPERKASRSENVPTSATPRFCSRLPPALRPLPSCTALFSRARGPPYLTPSAWSSRWAETAPASSSFHSHAMLVLSRLQAGGCL